MAGRAQLVYRLLEAYDLPRLCVQLIPQPASDQQLKAFHSAEYLTALNQISVDPDALEEQQEQYGLAYDCPTYVGLLQTVRLLVGGALAAAEALVDGRCRVALHWYGGWHHAQRDAAAGYCYVNDAVYSVLVLRRRYRRILYLDLDLHHGDGVEAAFSGSSSVLTLSLHHAAPGFFPGSGQLSECGVARGRYATANLPLKSGLDDSMLRIILSRLLQAVMQYFCPEALIVQCGADGLATDPHKVFNLSLQGYAACIRQVLQLELPTLLLGGGGYNHTDTAKLWTQLTGEALRVHPSLDGSDIPEHEHFELYGPDFALSVAEMPVLNQNTMEEVTVAVEHLCDNLKCLSERLRSQHLTQNEITLPKCNRPLLFQRPRQPLRN